MKEVMVGNDYFLNIPPDLIDTDVPWLLTKKSKMRFKFRKWGDLHGRKIKIKGFTKLIKNHVVVYLKEYPDEEFTVSKLSLTQELPGPACKCLVKTLMITGCKCGAFKKEKALSRGCQGDFSL